MGGGLSKDLPLIPASATASLSVIDRELVGFPSSFLSYGNLKLVNNDLCDENFVQSLRRLHHKIMEPLISQI